MTRFVLPAIYLFLILTSCNTTQDTDSKPLELSKNENGIFVGCIHSAGECRNSCPKRDGFIKEDSKKCSPSGSGADADLACYCPSETMGELPETPDGYSWNPVGCVRSANECKASAQNSKQFYIVVDPENCTQDQMDIFLCYHLKESN